MSAPLDPVRVVLDVARALFRAGVPYAIGGSTASTFHGEPRSTMDVDVIVHCTALTTDSLAAHLALDFLVDSGLLREAARRWKMANVIHAQSMTKVDLYFREASGFDAVQVARAVAVSLSPDSPQLVRLVSAEDIVLQKLRWFREGGEVSDRQWRDVLGVLETQAGRLDETHLDVWAERLGISDLLARARRPENGRR